MNLKDAIKQLLRQMPRLSIPKQANEIDDYISIIDFIKKEDGFWKKIEPKDILHIQTLIKDKSIVKRYWSTEMPEKLQYLALMLLGIEWLLYTANFEDAQKGKMILEEKLTKEIKQIVEVSK
jgi:hypothetical protein